MIPHNVIEGPGYGPVVVLHNSLGCALRMWDPQVPTLIEAGLRVLRYDYRGHGQSKSTPGAYTLADLGADALDLMSKHSLTRVVHVGLSLGGMVAMWLAENAPDAVTGMVLCSTSADLQPSSAWRDRAELVRTSGTTIMADALVPRWFSPSYLAQNPDATDKFREQIITTTTDGFAGCCDAIATMDLLPKLDIINVPTSVLVGQQDPGTPVEHARRIVDCVSGATLTVLNPGSHLLNVERPAAVSAAILAMTSYPIA